ncbi:hypothetical protein BLA29_008946, partial [Euroglyphus maynei]
MEISNQIVDNIDNHSKMLKSRSQEELTSNHPSNTFEFTTNLSSISGRNVRDDDGYNDDYDDDDDDGPHQPSTTTTISASPPQSPKSHPNYQQHEILQLNEDSHTWKLKASKRQQNIHQSNKSLQFCFGKLHSYLKTENAFEFRFKIIVAFLFLIICCVVMITRYFHYNLQISRALHDQILMFKQNKKITFLNDRGDNLVNLYY